MSLPSVRIGDLTVRIPIIQGGMGIGISMSGLAGAVAAEGGIGVISAANAGFREPDFYKNTFEANCRALAFHLKKARETAKNGVIGVNIMCRGNHYDDYVRCAVKNCADIIFSGAGLPIDLPNLIKGTKAKIAPIISTPKAARVLLKLWSRHHNCTADLVVIEGPKAGGHLGYSREDLARWGDTGYEKPITEILSIVHEYEEKYKKKIPVFFGGGVFNRKDIDHYLSLGLSGVQMATRFVVTKECDADERFKQMYIRAKKEDITLVNSPVHMVGRALNNPYVKKVSVMPEHITHCFHCLKECNPEVAPYCITAALIRAVRGDVDRALVFCGANAWRITKMTTVHDLMAELNQ